MPTPKNREFKEICIEHCYNDEDLFKKDSKGRRIFLSTEFNQETGLNKEKNLTSANKKILRSSYPKIIDQKVFDESGENLALSKNDFADYILNKVEPFNNVSFENFEEIFRVLKEIVDHSE